jgi:hypothetical protein
MATETPIRLYQNQLPVADTALYTVPAATTVIIRSIHAISVGEASYLTLSIGADSAATRIIDHDLVPTVSYGPYDWAGFIVMTAGEILRGHADDASRITLHVSGVSWA